MIFFSGLEFIRDLTQTVVERRIPIIQSIMTHVYEAEGIVFTSLLQLLLLTQIK